MAPEQKRVFIDGFRDVSQSGLTVSIWGLVTGIALAKSTLTVYQAIGMNLSVYAGVSQLVALPLIAADLPIWIILITSFIKRYPKPLTAKERQADPHDLPMYALMGMQFANWAFWQVGAISGILLASQIPDGWGLQFAGAVALVAIVMPMLDRPAARWAAVTAASVAVMTYGLPLRLNIMLAIFAAVIVGMMTDRSPKPRLSP
jgi:predicted branched-subunit amino acid permease